MEEYLSRWIVPLPQYGQIPVLITNNTTAVWKNTCRYDKEECRQSLKLIGVDNFKENRPNKVS
jgi:hypothetical protein